MYTYYWYLARKDDLPQFSKLKSDWLLVCPDFPNVFITDAELDTKTYRDSRYVQKARNIIDSKIQALNANGDTVPIGQQRLCDYFSFGVTVPDREPSSPSH